jgi:hypothetical protein
MKITLSRGFGAYGKAHKRRRKSRKGGRKTAQQTKMGRASKACKGRGKGFHKCVSKWFQSH